MHSTNAFQYSRKGSNYLKGTKSFEVRIHKKTKTRKTHSLLNVKSNIDTWKTYTQ